MSSGKKNREIQGKTQVRNVIRDSIVDGEVVASKLNQDVVGLGLRLNENTNAIEFAGEAVVETSSELTEAILSGESNIFLRNGLYELNNIYINQDYITLRGESKEGVELSLSPSGVISVSTQSGMIVTGNIEFKNSNPGIFYISGGNVSGNTPAFSWQNSYIIVDKIPHKVKRIVSGEVNGVATLELIDPWVGKENFSGKEFELMYLVDGFSLENLTVISSTANSGIINLDRVKSSYINNVAFTGRNVVTTPTSGIKAKNTYLSIFENIDIRQTKSNVGLNDKASIDVEDCHYIGFENASIYNVDSNAFSLKNSSFININSTKLSNVNGEALKIADSKSIEFSNNHLNNTGRGIEVTRSSNVYLQSNYFNTKSKDSIIKVYDSPDSVFINSNLIYGVSGTVGIDLSNSKSIVNLNVIKGYNTGINSQSGSISYVGNNIIEDSSIGISYDVSISGSTIDNNTVSASTNALEIIGSNNYISNNTILSGEASITSGNIFSVLSNVIPVFSGIIDIGSEKNTFQDLYINGDVKSPENIFVKNSIVFENSGLINFTDSGNIKGLNNIELNGLLIEAPGAGRLLVDGVEIAGTGGNASSGIVTYTHIQELPAEVWAINHVAGQKDFVVSTYDSSGNYFIPLDVKIIDENNVHIINTSPTTGKAVLLFTNANSGTVVNQAVSTLGQYTHRQASGELIWYVNHYFNTDSLIVQTYNADNKKFIPDDIIILNPNTVKIVNSSPQSGTATVLSKPGNIINQGQLVFKQPVASNLWSISHDYNSINYTIETFDESGNVFIPSNITTVSSGLIEVSNLTPVAGRAVIFFDNAEFIKAEASSGTLYVHNHGASETTWTITHNQGKVDYGITVFNSSGSVITPLAINTVDENTVEVQHITPRTGKATLTFYGSRFDPIQLQHIHGQYTPATTWNIYHGHNNKNYTIETFNESGEVYYPAKIETIDSNNIRVTNSTPVAGRATIVFSNANVSGTTEKLSGLNQTVVQEVFIASSGNVDLGTGASTVIPYDDSLPQLSEGVQVFSGNIIPLYTDTILNIETNVYVGIVDASSIPVISSLFLGNNSDAISATVEHTGPSGSVVLLKQKHLIDNNDVTEKTFTLRVGKNASANTLFMNSYPGVPSLGGIISSNMTIKEIRNYPV